MDREEGAGIIMTFILDVFSLTELLNIQVSGKSAESESGVQRRG